MSVDALVDALSRVELFQGLEPEQIHRLSRMAERVIYRPGDMISVAGREADAAILIVSGAAEWQDGPGDDIEIGSLIGEIAMFVDHSYGSTIFAKTHVRCLLLQREMMQQLLLEDPSIAESLTQRLAQRLQRVADELREIDDAVAPHSSSDLDLHDSSKVEAGDAAIALIDKGSGDLGGTQRSAAH